MSAASAAGMNAVRIHPAPQGASPYSASNPAPPSALVLEHVGVPVLEPGHVLVRVHAATVTRDELTWPESYTHESRIPGYDFAGVVAKVHEDDDSRFKPGDQVFAMNDIHNGASWAEFTVVKAGHLALKPETLSFEEAATVPMSALTAWQALFVQAGLPEPDFERHQSKRSGAVLVTGASGAVGAYAVQLAAAAGLRVVAASGSNEKNGNFLRSLGASEVVDYQEIASSGRAFGTIIDTVGGDPLAQSWSLVEDQGTIVTVNSSSFDFSDKHAPPGKERVKAIFFILEPSGKHLEGIARGLDLGALRAYVAYTFPLADAVAAYEKASGRLGRPGKVVLSI